MSNPVLNAIYKRRSCREFLDKDVSDDLILTILDAGRWAPSGKNLQPWKFIVVRDKNTKNRLAKLTIYGNIIKDAPVVIAVFLDTNISYDRVKDIQAIGACIQNMLLATFSLGLGGVWIGEILKNKEKVNNVLEAPKFLELMAVLAIGYPIEKERVSTRKPLSKIAYCQRYGKPIEGSK
ncbi:nitroreductase family protein [Candidatus Bathyarchaeota archaeon]|nr:nitroreductase family protein [Candidatus Bathyarchaeota archaeon]